MTPYRLEKLTQILLEANLLPTQTIGKQFMFAADHGSHSHLLLGTVTGIMYSDEGDLEVFVSIPTFWGRPLKSLKYSNGIWSAHLDIDDTEMKEELAGLHSDGSDEADRAEDEIVQRHLAAKFIAGEFELV